MEADRSRVNNNRLVTNWRGIWPKMFSEFPDTEFVLYHKHNNIKTAIPPNVRIIVKQLFTYPLKCAIINNTSKETTMSGIKNHPPSPKDDPCDDWSGNDIPKKK